MEVSTMDPRERQRLAREAAKAGKKPAPAPAPVEEVVEAEVVEVEVDQEEKPRTFWGG